jgi:hypothetical protein
MPATPAHCATRCGKRISQVEAGCSGERSQPVEDSGFVKTRGLLGEEVVGLAAQGAAQRCQRSQSRMLPLLPCA